MTMPTFPDHLNFSKLLAHPDTAELPVSIAEIFSCANHLACCVCDDFHMEKLIPYIERMPVLIQTIVVQGICRNNKKAIDFPAIKAWISRHAEDMNKRVVIVEE